MAFLQFGGSDSNSGAGGVDLGLVFGILRIVLGEMVRRYWGVSPTGKESVAGQGKAKPIARYSAPVLGIFCILRDTVS